MNSEKALLDNIQKYDFALQEANLFLISHPDDKSAMAYYQHFKALLQHAKQQYEHEYGPLTSRSNESDKWKYVYGPWPWEGGN